MSVRDRLSSGQRVGGRHQGVSLILDESLASMIEEIEKRPILYNKELKEYADSNLKNNLWTEVCEKIILGWDVMDNASKQFQIKEAKKRWDGLRGCFRRELRKQKETKSGQAAKRRKPYIYFDKLLFLLPHVNNPEGNLDSPALKLQDFEFFCKI